VKNPLFEKELGSERVNVRVSFIPWIR